MRGEFQTGLGKSCQGNHRSLGAVTNRWGSNSPFFFGRTDKILWNRKFERKGQANTRLRGSFRKVQETKVFLPTEAFSLAQSQHFKAMNHWVGTSGISRCRRGAEHWRGSMMLFAFPQQ